ncbi:hypothetical protein CBR_g6681 [Chara braunii]|uniref:Uncharacterized protein n=1 Tax=Chara braunii TaxID=69332 RepID=A0A388KKG8_CHABU|nr:hypothetical protein CBR_g6681 [Chara braunii]|eukprot:GBG70555.1 hypothetical protein CBR_g6681 [Chara braunii]
MTAPTTWQLRRLSLSYATRWVAASFHERHRDGGSNAGRGGHGKNLRQCDDATDDYFNEKQHSAEEQQRGHQKEHSDEELQREPAVQVGHELHGGEGSNEHTMAEKARVLSDVQHVTTCMGIRRL